jgi:phage terminase large subunit
MLTLGLLYPGDYLIAREFMPELKDTTLKTFLEVIYAVGKEVMIEHRVADNIIRVRSRGGVANFLFRGLEEPDKLRSLNLNAFLIDEAAQVSEAAFLLLQGRLRGKYVRKGFLTQNSGGHDWTYRYFVKKDMFKNEEVKKEFLSIKAPSTENKHLPEGYVETILATWSEERIKREIYADEDAFEGQVYADFRSNIHVVQPFKIPDEWTRVIGADHGFRNPACWLWGAVDYDGNIFIYREFYKKEWVIEEICKGKTYPGGKREPGVLGLMYDPEKKRHERIDQIRIDPSTRAQRGSGKSDWDLYIENLPEGFPLMPANNEKTAGIDRVKSYLKINPNTSRAKLYIFNTCPNLIEEIANYRYDEIPAHLQGKKNEKEEPRKVNDHACDALRYLIMSQPETERPEDDIYNRLKYNSLEGQLYRELQEMKRPKTKDPFGSGF